MGIYKKYNRKYTSLSEKKKNKRKKKVKENKGKRLNAIPRVKRSILS